MPYLHVLGVTDIYASPYFQAVPGSTHGYDITDPTALNPELGSVEDYAAFAQALKDYGLGQILDVVPNHMGVAESSNPWWLDVLENGPGSAYAAFFDIDWHPIKPELDDKVLLPILGDLYGVVLERQEITLVYGEGSFWIRYWSHRLPIAPKSFVRILAHRLDELVQQAGTADPHVQELQSIITALGHLPSRSERDPGRVAERYREQEIIKRRLSAVTRESTRIAQFVEENVRLFNGTKDDQASFDLLDALLNDQAYRLAYWRVASEEINYRRFFDINDMVAVRMEDPAVFQAFHVLIFRLLQEGAATGLRIDHVDGLYDPADYLRRVQGWARSRLFADDPDAGDRPLFLIVEKILGPGEPLPETWPVYGTTGYDFLNLVNGLFVDTAHERSFDELYARLAPDRKKFEDLVYETKKLIMKAAMSSEINVLGHQLNRLSERDRRSRDFTLNSLIHAIREIIACFPVYRTYAAPDLEEVLERDRAYIRLAVMKAKRRNPAHSGLVFDFVRDLLLKSPDGRREEDRQERLQFVMKFEQTTSPVTAKGVEDTAFYVYNRLISLNEVGGDPQRFGLTPAMFHSRMQERQSRSPHSLSATSTHDTKRSEDVRARINALSEVPQLWRAHVARWSKLNKKHKTDVDGQLAPDRNEEYLLYQTLIGTWPLSAPGPVEFGVYCDRIQAYMSKALQEAKVHTSWINPHQVYHEAVHKFIEAVLDRSRSQAFLEDFVCLHEKIAQDGMYNSLAQLVLKLSAPGIPDFYQGAELWDFSLVDPDNRRPVDYTLRAQLLEELRKAVEDPTQDRRALARQLLESRADGRVKLYVTAAGLNYRRAHPDLFSQGTYAPLEGQGAKRDHLCAFRRTTRQQAVTVAVPRLIGRLIPDATRLPVGAEVWGDTALMLPAEGPARRHRNIFTGEVLTSQMLDGRWTLPLADVFRDFPVVMLEDLA